MSGTFFFPKFIGILAKSVGETVTTITAWSSRREESKMYLVQKNHLLEPQIMATLGSRLTAWSGYNF